MWFWAVAVRHLYLYLFFLLPVCTPKRFSDIPATIVLTNRFFVFQKAVLVGGLLRIR